MLFATKRSLSDLCSRRVHNLNCADVDERCYLAEMLESRRLLTAAPTITDVEWTNLRGTGSSDPKLTVSFSGSYDSGSTVYVEVEPDGGGSFTQVGTGDATAGSVDIGTYNNASVQIGTGYSVQIRVDDNSDMSDYSNQGHVDPLGVPAPHLDAPSTVDSNDVALTWNGSDYPHTYFIHYTMDVQWSYNGSTWFDYGTTDADAGSGTLNIGNIGNVTAYFRITVSGDYGTPSYSDTQQNN